MARIRRFGEQMLVSQLVFIGQQVFQTKPENDSDITRTSQPTRSRPVVCVGLITCLELARKTHARGGHWTEAGTAFPSLIPWVLRQGLMVPAIGFAGSRRMRPLPLVPDARGNVLLQRLQVATFLWRHECMDVKPQRRQLFLSLSLCLRMAADPCVGTGAIQCGRRSD